MRRQFPLFKSLLSILVVLSLALGTATACRHRVGHVPPGPTAQGQEKQKPTPAPVILVSFDGWRWDYDRKAPAPNLKALIARGVRAERLIPSFPSKTFPNHYSVVTGLYPAHHGIVANNIFDPGERPEIRPVSDREAVGDSRWWGGEPIWVTVQRQGGRAATLFWPGSEAAIGGIRPHFWSLYDGKMTNEARVDQGAGVARSAARRAAVVHHLLFQRYGRCGA